MPRIWSIAIAVAFLGLPVSTALSNLGGSSTSDETASTEDATALIDAGDYESALDQLAAIVKNDADNADAYNLIGYVHRRLQNFDLAFENYGRALEIDPEHTGAHHYIGEAYLETENLEMAEQHLARLNIICLFGCEDFDELQEAVDLYRANHSS